MYSNRCIRCLGRKFSCAKTSPLPLSTKISLAVLPCQARCSARNLGEEGRSSTACVCVGKQSPSASTRRACEQTPWNDSKLNHSRFLKKTRVSATLRLHAKFCVLRLLRVLCRNSPPTADAPPEARRPEWISTQLQYPPMQRPPLLIFAGRTAAAVSSIPPSNRTSSQCLKAMATTQAGLFPIVNHTVPNEIST